MDNLKKIIINKINSSNGFISIEKFINISLYNKKYGYYIKKNPIGRDADFITSPEISELFAILVYMYEREQQCCVCCVSTFVQVRSLDDMTHY